MVTPPALDAGVRALLATEPDLHVLEAGGNGTSHVSLEEGADVVIITSASVDVLQTWWAPKMEATAVLLLGDAQSGAEQSLQERFVLGIVPLDVSGTQLAAAVRALAAGLTVRGAANSSNEAASGHPRGPLTEREVEVLGLLARGMANKQIAVDLGISEHTVKYHVTSIFTKLDVGSRTQAVREGLRNGWIAL